MAITLRYSIYSFTRMVNPLTGTLKLQNNGPLYSNTVIGTLAVDGWAVTFGTVRRGLGVAATQPGRFGAAVTCWS